MGRVDQETAIGIANFCTKTKRVRAKNEFVRKGQSTGHLHILISGWPCRCKDLSDGKRQITSLLLAGDIWDLDSLYIDPPDESLYALTPCDIALVSRADLKRLMRRDS